jgi:ribose 5-phosphate isomerase B
MTGCRPRPRGDRPRPFVYDAPTTTRLLPAGGRAASSADARRVSTARVVIGGSGNGEQIAANKVQGIRCALVWSEETAVLAREHNDANVVSVGGRMHSLEDMTRFVEVFVSTPFSEDERHVRRIAQVMTYDETKELPPLPESALRPDTAGGSTGA